MKKLTLIIILFTVAFNLNAQIVYVNPDPDKIVTINYGELVDFYPLTGISSRHLWFYINPLEKSIPYKANDLKFGVDLYKCNFVRKPGVGDPDKLTFGHQINASSVWQWPSQWEGTNAILAVEQGEDVSGAWVESDGNFLGLRFLDNNGDTIYGWVRLTVNISEETIRIHDYALNLTPNEGILAGEGLEFCASDITIFDASDNGDVRDFWVDFKISAEEDSVNYYKIFLVPSEIADDFDLTQAENVLPENYLLISPSGSNYYSQMPIELLDVNGNQISEHMPYNAFVLTNYRFEGATLNCLSDKSNEEILDENLKYFNPEPNLFLDASDGGSENMSFDFNQDGVEDLKFKFAEMNYTDVRCDHHLYYLSEAAVFNPIYGRVLNDYTTFYDNGHEISYWVNDYTISENWFCAEPLTDVFFGFKYNAETDTSYGWIRIETDSVLRRLYIKDYAYFKGGFPIYVGQGINLMPEKIKLEDISDQHNSSDILLSFDRFFLESEVVEYRLMFVPEENAENFTLSDAESVLGNRYLRILPSGTDYSDTLPANLVDVNGNTIAETILYKAFILTISTGGSSFTNCISQPVDISIFTNVEQVYDLTVSSTYNGFANYTFEIEFYTPIDESGIDEYRAYLVPEIEAVSFDTVIASTITAGNYISFEKNAPFDRIYALYPRSELRDINGNILGSDTEYFVFVMSVTNWNMTNRNNLLISDSTVTFFTPCIAPDSVYVLDVGDVGNPADIEVHFKTLADESLISGYRIFVLPESEANGFNLFEAETVPEGNYYEIESLGMPSESYSVVLPANCVQFNGNAIVPDQAYLFFVMAVANNISSDFNALSSPSQRFIYGYPGYFFTGKMTGENIEYHNPEPNISFSIWREEAIYYEIDLNHDYINDLQFVLNSSGSPSYSEASVKVVTLNSSSILTTNSYRCEAFYYLNNQVAWSSGTLLLQRAGGSPVSPWSSTGLWNSAGPGYIAVKILTPNDTVYAWMNLQIYASGSSSLTIYDYALFGEYLSVEDNQISASTIYPNPSNGNFTIIFEDYIAPFVFEITDISGRVVYRGKAISNITEVDLSDNPKGMYFIRSTEKNLFKKIVIQ